MNIFFENALVNQINRLLYCVLIQDAKAAYLDSIWDNSRMRVVLLLPSTTDSIL